MTRPRVGVARVYTGETCPVIYPGEVARPEIGPLTPELVRRALATDGKLRLPVTGWIVEPAPGWRARWQRVRYRVWGRWWFTRGAPKLDVTGTIEERVL